LTTLLDFSIPVKSLLIDADPVALLEATSVKVVFLPGKELAFTFGTCA